MASGPGKVISTLPEHLKAMGQRYSHPVLVTGAGSRLIAADYWNHGLRKNMPHHFKVWMKTEKCAVYIACFFRYITNSGVKVPENISTRGQRLHALKRTNGERFTRSRTQGYMLSTPKSSTKVCGEGRV